MTGVTSGKVLERVKHGLARARRFRAGAAQMAERTAARVLPAGVRRLVRRWSGGRAAVLESWAVPFVAGRPAPDFPTQPLLVTPGVRPAGTDTGTLARCLLVTDTLETGGVDEVVAFLARQLPLVGLHTAVLVASDVTTKGIGLIGHQLIAEGTEVADPGPEAGPEWIKQWRPDVIYLHGGMQWPVETANTLGVPAAVVLHGMHDVYGLPGEVVARRAAKLSGVVAVSEIVRREFLAASGSVEPTTSVVVIPNGVDPAKVSNVQRAECRTRLGLQDEFLFVSLARHCMQKNTYALVSAFEEVACDLPNAHLLVCGRVDEPVYTKHVISLQSRSPFRTQIHLRDNVQRIDVVLGAADAFVLDSFFEGWALASMEALCAGVPVVLSDVGGAREQLEGDLPGGTLIPNPLGEPVGLTWDMMRQARFGRQVNRGDLVDAMRMLGSGGKELPGRGELAERSLARFSSARSVRAHADFLLSLIRTRLELDVGGGPPLAESS